MATISKEFALELIKGNGFCKVFPDNGAPDNPSAIRIIEYTNMASKLAYGVIFEGEQNIYRYETESEYIKNPKVFWEKQTDIESSINDIKVHEKVKDG